MALGKYYTDFARQHIFTQIIDVEAIIAHPSYEDFVGNYASDLAIVILQYTVMLNQFIHPVSVDWNLAYISQHLSENSLGLVNILH